MKKFLSLFLFGLLLSGSLSAQYNFFVGNDADQLGTTMKGFGSISFPPIMFNVTSIQKEGKTFNYFYSMNVGYNGKQWRFGDNTMLGKTDGVMIAQAAPADERYTNEFFSYTKSKLYTGVIRIRPEVGIVSKNNKISFGTGPLIEITTHAKTKRKYYDTNGDKQKTTMRGIGALNLNWFNVGWGASLGSYRFGAFTYAMFTPQFKKDKGPEVYAAEIGLYFRYFDKALKSTHHNDVKMSMLTY